MMFSASWLSILAFTYFSCSASPTASKSREDAVLRHCEKYDAFLAPIFEDLLPWASGGIPSELSLAALKAQTVGWRADGADDAGLGFLFENGTLHVLATPLQMVQSSFHKHHAVMIAVLQDVVESYGMHLPPIEFSLQLRDIPSQWRHRPDDRQPPLPVFRFCKTEEAADIAVPYFHFYTAETSRSFFRSLTPDKHALSWRERSDVAYGNFHKYPRICQPANSTERRGERGERLSCEEKEAPRQLISDWAERLGPAANISLGSMYKPMSQWSEHKYLVHMDGITCSSKLEQSLATGSLLLVESSGYRSFFGRMLLPYEHFVPFWRNRPQELLQALAWAHAHDEEAQRIARAGQAFARRFFSGGALRCYWAQLWVQYARLLRFKPSCASHEHCVPTGKFLREVREMGRQEHEPAADDPDKEKRDVWESAKRAVKELNITRFESDES